MGVLEKRHRFQHRRLCRGRGRLAHPLGMARPGGGARAGDSVSSLSPPGLARRNLRARACPRRVRQSAVRHSASPLSDPALFQAAHHYSLSFFRRLGQSEKAKTYSMIRLTIGTTMSRLSHRGNPAFEKMNQNGRMINAAKISIMKKPNGHIGVLDIISGMRPPWDFV